MYVKPKKALGQHFLKDEQIARRIVDSLDISDNIEGARDRKVNVIEVGPGTGVLTRYLISDNRLNLKLAEIDAESVEYLRSTYPELGEALLHQDFLKTDLSSLFQGEFMVIGNFPYNISSQIFFKILDYKESVYCIVGMLQKEVAERLASAPGSKSYGILSVLLQAWYDIEYLFTVHENSFIPPPKVKSGVIRLTRNGRGHLDCDEKLFKQVVKVTFNQRRKTIRNSLKPLLSKFVSNKKESIPADLFRYSYLLDKRPEQLSVEEFMLLTSYVETLRR